MGNNKQYIITATFYRSTLC